MNRCCHVCRSSLMTCLESGNCPCHWWQEAKEKRGGLPHADPTANQAVGNLSRKNQQRRNRRQND